MLRSLRSWLSGQRSSSARVRETFRGFEGAQGRELKTHLASVRAFALTGESLTSVEWIGIQYGGLTMPLSSLTVGYGSVRLRIGLAGDMHTPSWTLYSLCPCGGQMRSPDGARRVCRACNEDRGPWEGTFLAIPLHRTRTASLSLSKFLSDESRRHVATMAEQELERELDPLEATLAAAHFSDLVDRLVALNHTWRSAAWERKIS